MAANSPMPVGPVAMTFRSVLFNGGEDRPEREVPEAPDFFPDLNLDQVVDAITADKPEYDLKPFFHAPVKSVDAIQYRHEIMQDLERGDLLKNLEKFADKLSAMRRQLARIEKLGYEANQQGWFLEMVILYCEAVGRLARDLALADLRSRGLLAFREHLADHVRSGRFTSLLAETRKLKGDLSSIRYGLLIKGNSVKVRDCGSETNYSVEVVATFDRFRQGAGNNYTIEFSSDGGMNHVEAGILALVAKLHPDIFLALEKFCAGHRDYVDPTIARFDREIQFYISYLDYVAPLKKAGLPFCYPQVSDQGKDVYDHDGFDLALARKLVGEGGAVVRNDFRLEGKERVFVVSGPNQGGKTTFARMFGQLHYLASIGCPVPGREARLFLCDRIFTHFEKEEHLANLRGKLRDDLVRIHSILEQATPRSLVILNEIFTSTTLQDAVFLSRRVMEKILRLEALCVWVTFIVELVALGEANVSMVSTVVPENPALRTYKILRKPADGLSYAVSIAEKYRLTSACLKERIRP